MEIQTGEANVENRSECQTAIDCYLAAFSLIGRTLAEVCPHIGATFETSLVRVRQRLAFQPNEPALVASLEALDQDLGDFGRRASEYFNRKSADVASVLDLITQATETFENRDHLYLERLNLLARQMDAGLKAQNEEDLRKTYTSIAAHLKSFVERLEADSHVVFDKVRGELGAVEDSLLRAEAEASIDPLTSLANRREIMRLIRERTAQNRKFSLLLFDIRSLSRINARFGQLAGDQVLKQFGARLSAQVRPRDVVARWGGDEFAVIFDCSGVDARPRAEQIAQWVSGRYPVLSEGREWKPEVEASVVVVEYRAGETESSFAARATQGLREHREPTTTELVEADAGISVAEWPS